MLFKSLDKATGKVSYRKVNVATYYGNVPLHVTGINIGRLDIQKLSEAYGWSVSDVVKARENWVTIFRYEESDLTFEQYLRKLVDKGLSPKDVGNKSGQFNLSRLDDRGGYTNENCRFITRQMNLLEQTHGLHRVLDVIQNKR